jgi:hypothetical protein
MSLGIMVARYDGESASVSDILEIVVSDILQIVQGMKDDSRGRMGGISG